MNSKLLKGLFGGLVLLVSTAADAGVILDAPSSVLIGEDFDVEVRYEVDPELALSEAVVSFDFDVTGLSGISLVGATVNPAFDIGGLGIAGNVSGFSLFGIPSNTLSLATLTFSADVLGAGSAGILGLGSAAPFPGGVQIQDALTFESYFQDIAGDFSVQIVAADVPLPGTLALLGAGLLLLRRRLA